MTTKQAKSLRTLTTLLSFAALLCSLHSLQQISAGSKESNSRIRQVAESVQTGRKSYPDYCWFSGLENRILAEYPKLLKLVDLHDKKLHREANIPKAVDLHKQIFREIYLDEVQRMDAKKDALARRKATTGQDDPGVGSSEEQKVYTPAHLAAYKLFDLWANTPGDFEKRQGDYANYLDSYLLQPGIQFWSYCFSEPTDCHRVLSQLDALARKQELGPVELMQISMNMIMLMNHYKADLVLDKLTSRGLLKAEDMPKIGAQDADNDPRGEEEREEDRQNAMIKNIATLIESDDDFNEATFFYVFMLSDKIQDYVDTKLEDYFVDRINKFMASNNEQLGDLSSPSIENNIKANP